MPRKLSHLEDMTVVIELPTPRLLGHGSLGDDQFNLRIGGPKGSRRECVGECGPRCTARDAELNEIER